jgi:hypothetical protein
MEFAKKCDPVIEESFEGGNLKGEIIKNGKELVLNAGSKGEGE